MSGYLLHDAFYQNAMSRCSPRIKRFLERLDAGDKLVQWSLLENNGFKKNGYFFAITDAWRSMSEQISYYKKGREVSISSSRSPFGAKFPYKGVKYVLDNETITDKSKVVTYTFGGKSKHNYGLAVDVRFDALGWKTDDIEFNGAKVGLKQIYKESGLPLLALDCGLKWGGDWSDLYDPYHFEDTGFKIPPGYELNYDDNCNFDFIDRYNNGTLFDNEEGTGASSSGGGFLSRLALFALGAVSIFGIIKGLKNGL